MKHNHKKKNGGSMTSFSSYRAKMCCFLIKKMQFYVIFGTICTITQTMSRHGNSTPNGVYTPKWDFLYSEIVMSTPFSRNCDQRLYSQTILSSNVYNLSSNWSFSIQFSAVVSSFQPLSTQPIHCFSNMCRGWKYRLIC